MALPIYVHFSGGRRYIQSECSWLHCLAVCACPEQYTHGRLRRLLREPPRLVERASSSGRIIQIIIIVQYKQFGHYPCELNTAEWKRKKGSTCSLPLPMISEADIFAISNYYLQSHLWTFEMVFIGILAGMRLPILVFLAIRSIDVEQWVNDAGVFEKARRAALRYWHIESNQ